VRQAAIDQLVDVTRRARHLGDEQATTIQAGAKFLSSLWPEHAKDCDERRYDREALPTSVLGIPIRTNLFIPDCMAVLQNAHGAVIGVIDLS
jgi:hypothetical protein